MPEKPKSLADEYPRIVLVVETCDFGHKYGKASGARHGCPWCLTQGLAEARSRLTAIESELNDLRKDALTWRTRIQMQGEALASQPPSTTTSAPGEWMLIQNNILPAAYGLTKFTSAEDPRIPPGMEVWIVADEDQTSVPPRIESHSTLVNGLPTPPGLDFVPPEWEAMKSASGLPCSSAIDEDDGN